MGLFYAMTNMAHKAELRESKDEIAVGWLIRSLAHRGWVCHRLEAHSDRQQLGFRIPGDPVLSAVYLVVDRRSGSGAISASMGSKTTLGFAAEMRNKVSDPDDLATMWRTDLANLFKVPVAGEIRINHQLNTVLAKTHHLIDLDHYVDGVNVDVEPLAGWVVEQVDALREALRPLKK